MPSPIQRSRVTILGIGIDRLTMAETIEKFREFLLESTPRLVLTADASSIYMASHRPDVREIFERADLVTADGSGVVWAAKKLGTPVQERVSGVELVDELFALSAKGGYRIYCLGASPGIAELAAARLMERHPGSIVVGSRDGYFKPEMDEDIAFEVAKTKPDILLVAMGLPRQEQFILKTQSIIQAKVSMGVGGSFDVFSGTVKRAPVFLQRMRLEWLWRVIQDPSKMHRIKCLPKFAREVRDEAKSK